VGFFSLCLFLGMLIKRSAFALAFLFVLYILEWIAFGLMVWKLDMATAEKIQNFFPLKSMYKLIDQPFQRIAMTKFPDKANLTYDYSVHGYEIAIVLGWTALFIFLSYRLLKRRDL
jgi:ABC-type transport system involved in multi-copper enzyme maturation permease subunit